MHSTRHHSLEPTPRVGNDHVTDNPFLELIDAKLVGWEEGYSEFHLPVHAKLLNRQGVLQGGVISTLLDAACGYAGLYAPPGAQTMHGHTVSLTVNFMNKATAGTVIAKGFLEQRGRSMFFSRGEAWLDNHLLLATSQACFKLIGPTR